MLFQPTFTSPSLQWGIGNGTVDVTNGIEFSWQVNGSSAMTSFEITIYKNDANSTFVYTTSEITYNCPFYGTDYAGNAVPFTYFISGTTLTGAGMTNGEEYKFVITQWWSALGSVQQSSATAFQTRTTPTLSITSFNIPVTSRSQTFTATYTQNEGDAIDWVRWQIALTSDTSNPVFDTGIIYGTSDLQCTYDGLFTGEEYAVRCIIQTENGIEVGTGWEIFDVSYSTSTLTGAVDASCVCKHDAVKVSWDSVTYIPAVTSGTYSIANGLLNLDNGAVASWSSVNGNGLSLSAPWTLFYKTKLVSNSNINILELVTADGSISFRQFNNLQIQLRINGTTKGFVVAQPNDEITIALTPDSVYFYVATYGGGLYPDSTLTPELTRYPADDVLQAESSKTVAVSYTQTSITSVTLNGAQICDYVLVEGGTVAQSILDNVIIGAYTPIADEGTQFFANFDYGLNAGNLSSTGDTLVGYAVYRNQEGSGTLQHLIDVSISDTYIYDFGVGSQQGVYTYYVFPIGESTYVAEPLVSNQIDPSFWNWTILQCSQRGDGTYKINREFKFANNVSSGSVTNNNTPNVVKNFTRYPIVQSAPQNYQSGTLSALIGTVDYTTNTYSDTLSIRDEIWALSTTRDTLFLKNRKGDVLEIRISSPIQMTTSDNTAGQIISATIPWVQIADAKNTPIVALNDDAIIA